jgi:hypothetical protein
MEDTDGIGGIHGREFAEVGMLAMVVCQGSS